MKTFSMKPLNIFVCLCLKHRSSNLNARCGTLLGEQGRLFVNSLIIYSFLCFVRHSSALPQFVLFLAKQRVLEVKRLPVCPLAKTRILEG